MAETEMVMEEAFSVNMEKRLIVIPGVDDIREALPTFQWPDYVICIVWLVMCLIVGVYFGFFYVATTTQEYLVGHRRLKVVPVAMSLTASFMSGMLTLPIKTYLYGIQSIYLIIGHLAMTTVMTCIYLPVFNPLNLTSAYEYLERRFNKTVRIFGSLLFIISTIACLPIVIFVPISAFNEVTRLDAQFIAPILCMIGIFYTSLGGIKAVVWTDVIQTIIIFSALMLVAIKGTLDIGGINLVVDRNLKTDRIEGPNLDLNSSAMYTFWSTTIGGSIYYLHTSAINQNMLQKYFSLRSATSAKRTAWLFTLALCVAFILCTFCGFLMYAMFYQCDPLTTKLARENNKLLPLFVAKVLGNFPGLLGLFVAGIWSASLSFWGSSLHAVTTVIFEDFYSLMSARQLTEKQHSLLMKLTVIIVGIICVGLTYTINNVGIAVEISKMIGHITSGPSLGIFTGGIIFPWINGKGVLVGGISSLLVMTWLNINKSTNALNFILSEKALTTEGCHYHFIPQHSHINVTSFIHSGKEFSIYDISYLWYTLLGTLVTVIVALIVSVILEPSDPRDVDPRLLAPFLKKIIKPREFPNEPGDSIIYAFDTSKKANLDGPLKNIPEPK